MSRNDLIPDTFAKGVAWLHEHEDELETAPVRIHDFAVGDKDASGSLRFSAPFWAILVGTPFATRWASEMRACPEARHGAPYPICSRCNDQYAYTVHRELYVHPLAAALAALKPAPATSKSWPTPFELVVTLLRSDCSIERAGDAIGQPVLGSDHRGTLEAAFLLAIRKLVGRWASGPIPKTPRWLDLSDSQRSAMDAA